jgi:hypothetical protein
MSADLTSRGRWLAVFALVAALSVGLVACGGDDNGDQNGSGEGQNANATGATGDTGTTGATGATGAGAAAGSTASPTIDSTSSSSVDSIRFFSNDSPWNTEVDGLPVDPDSTRMLDLATERRAVREVKGQEGVITFTREKVDDGLYVTTEAWAPLIVSAGGENAQVTRMVCRQKDCGPGDPPVPSQIALPSGTTPDPRFDGWLSVIDLDRGAGYDFWRARRQTDGTISFQFSKGWTLDGPGFSNPVGVDPERAVGARGSGLPLFAGVIGPAEVAQGRINHALAMSVPGLARRNFVQPASATDGVGVPSSLPAGARIRLKASVTPDDRDFEGLNATQRRSAESILVALKQYGAIIVDRSAVPTLYAPRGTSRELINGNELEWVDLQDFEVVQLPQIYKDPPLSQVALEGPADQPTVQSGSRAGGQEGGE